MSKTKHKVRLTWYQKAKIRTTLLRQLMLSCRQYDTVRGRIVWVDPEVAALHATQAAHAAKKAKRTGWCG